MPRDPRTLSDDELTADVVIEMPTLDDIRRAGYEDDRLEEIHREVRHYRERFTAEPEFRASMITRFRAHLAAGG